MRLLRNENDDDDVRGETPADPSRHVLTCRCSKCGSTTWEHSISCEHCGAFLRDPPSRPAWLWIGGGLVLLAIVLGGIWRL